MNCATKFAMRGLLRAQDRTIALFRICQIAKLVERKSRVKLALLEGIFPIILRIHGVTRMNETGFLPTNFRQRLLLSMLRITCRLICHQLRLIAAAVGSCLICFQRANSCARKPDAAHPLDHDRIEPQRYALLPSKTSMEDTHPSRNAKDCLHHDIKL
jgi:hypothetical protein